MVRDASSLRRDGLSYLLRSDESDPLSLPPLNLGSSSSAWTCYCPYATQAAILTESRSKGGRKEETTCSLLRRAFSPMRSLKPT